MLHHLSYVAYMHLMAWFGVVKPSIRVDGSSHYKWCNLFQLLVPKALDQHMMRSWFHLCVACILTLKCNLGSLGYHAPRCIIDGPRTKGHAPLSPKHDREALAMLTYAQNPIPCTVCLLLLSKLSSAGILCRPAVHSADRQYIVPTGTIFTTDNLISSRWKL